MQSSRHSAKVFTLHVTRLGVAVVLVLALLAGIAPSGSLSLAAASECSMSCCAGLPPHPAGECASVVSCHVKLPKHIAAGDAPHDESHVRDMAAPSHQHNGDNSVNSDNDDAHHAAESQTAAHHASHSAPAETQQAQSGAATHSSATHSSSHAASHASLSSLSSQQTSPPDGVKQSRRRHTGIARASLANPCPPDCGMAAGGAGNVLRRSRDAATLTGAHRPRPPTLFVARTHASGFPLNFSAGKYRLAPPRAPPLPALN